MATSDPKKLSIAVLALKKKGMMGEKDDDGDNEDDKMSSDEMSDDAEDSLNSAIESVAEDFAQAVDAESKQGMKMAFIKLAHIIKSAS